MLKKIVERIKSIFCRKPQQKPKIIAVDIATGEDQTNVIKVTIEKAKESEIKKIEEWVRKEAEFELALEKMLRQEQRQNTNNWRKMHKLPMRRRGGETQGAKKE